MNQIKKTQTRILFFTILILFVSTNMFAFDATFNYSDNISLNFNLKDTNYSFNITKINITIYNSSNNIIFSQENESESINFHDISIPIFIENQYNPSKELYTLSPGSYTVEIFGYDFFNNIKNQNFSFEILKPEFLQNDFIFEIHDNIKYATNFSIDIKNKNNIPYKINKIVLTTNDYTIITHCSIKNISYYKNIQENYASNHGYEYFYSEIQDLYCENAPFEEQHLLSKFKNEKLKLLLNVTSAFSQNILLIKDNISSDFKLKFEINPINFNETSWNVIGKNKEMIFEIKTNNELGGKINDTINEFNDDESREFRLNENNLYVYNSFFNFSDYKFYYTYGFNYPNENQSILFNKPYNISELEYIDENYFSSLNPIPIFQTNHEIVNRSGLGYVFINYTKNKSDNLRLIPKMDNGYYDPLIFYNFDMVYDNVNPEINITNINESSLIVQYANKKIYVRIEDKNIPKCDDFDFFQMRIYANEEIIIKEPYKVLLNLTDKNGNEVSNFTINLTVSNIDKTINIPIIEESTSDLREYLNIFDFSNENFQINGIIYENPEENYYNYTFSDIISEKVGNDYYFKIQMNDYPMSCETFGIRTGYSISKVCGLNEVCINNIYYGEDECCYSKDPESELEDLCVTLEDSEDDEVISEDFIIPTQNPREFPEDKFFTCNNAELREGEGFQDGVYLTFNSDLDEDFTYNISVVVFDKGYNRNEINYTNITISELNYKFEINNKNDLNEIFLAKNYYDKFYLKEGKFNALIRYSQSNNPKYEENDAEINITIKDSLGSTIENLECYYIKPPTTEKYNEENDFYYNETLQEFINDGFIYECNNTIALNEGKYSIIKKIYNSSNTSQIYSEDYILTNNFLTIDKQNPIIDTENLGNKIQRIEKEFFYKFKISDNEGYSVSDIHYELKRKDECQILSDLEIQDGYYKLKIKCDKENIGNTDLIINVTDYAGNFKAEEIDLQVAELKIIPEIKIDSQKYALDSNKIYLYNFQEVNYSIEFHHNHGLNLTNLDCSIFYKNNENTQTSSSINSSNSKILTIYDNKNIQTVSELKYSCIAYDENQERYDFDIEYDFDIFGIYSINLLSNKLFLNKLFEFELYTISDINLSSSKFKLYYLEEEIKDFECVSFGLNKYLCNLTLSSNDLKIYENILDGFNSDSLPKFDLKAEIDFYDEEIYDIKVTKEIDWDFYKTQIIDDEDIIIPLENITDMKHFYCDKNLTCFEESINIEDYENGFYFLNSSQRNEIDAYSFSNNSLIESLIFLKSNNLYKNPIDLTNKKECNFEVLKDKLNDNSQYGKYIIYKTNCDPQINFKYDFINYNYLDDIYYLKLNSSSQEDNFVLSIMIDDIIFNKEIKNYNLGENKEIYISGSNSNLLKKIDIFDLFYKDNSINRYYEKSNNNFKKLELNSSYDSINITKNNLITTNNLGGNSIENYKFFDLKVSSNVENSLYKCYLMFNNEIIDVKYGYNFKENDQIKKNDIKFDTQLTSFAGKFVESKVYCNFLNSNLNYKMFEKNYTITSNPQDFGNTEFKNQEVLLNKKGFPQNFEQDGIIKSANSDFEINSGYNKFNLNYLNQSYTNQEVIYTDLNEIKIFTNQNKGVLIYNPYQVSNITYEINGIIKSSINKYSSILLSDSITNTNNKIEIKYIINGQEKIITKTFDKTNDKIISESENIIYYDSNFKTYFMKYNSNQEQFKFNFGQGNNDVNFYSNCNISKSPSEYIVNLDEETCYLYSEKTKIIFINESQIYNKVNLLITKDSKILDVLDLEQRIRFDKGNVFSQTKNVDNKYFIDLLNLDEKLFLSNIYLNENDLTCNLESYDFIKNNDFFRSVENLNPYGTFNLSNLKYNKLCVKSFDNYILNLTELSKNNLEIIDGKNNLLISSSNNIQVGKQFYNESGFNQINYLNDFIKDYISPQIIEIGNYSNNLKINFSEDPILEKDELYFTKNQLDELKIDSSSLFNKKIIKLSFTIDGRNFETIVDYDEENIKIINYLNNEYIIQEGSGYDLGEEFNLSYENNFFVLKYKSNEQFRFKNNFEDSIIILKNLNTTFDLNINLETINSEIFIRELKLRKIIYGKVLEFFSDTYNEQQIIGIFNEYESKDNIKLKEKNFSFYTDYELKCNYTLKYAQNAYNEYEDEFLNYHVYNINYTTFTDSTIGDVEIKCSNQEGKLMLERNFQINGSLKNNELILQKFSLFGSEDEIKKLINYEISKGEVLIYYDSSNTCGLNFGMEWLAKKQVKLIKDNINLIYCNGENLNIYLKNIESNDIIKFDFFVLNENENNKFRIFGENQSIPKTGKNYIYTFSNYICKVNEIECAGSLKLHECQIDNEIFNLFCQRTDGTNNPINERDYNLTANNQIILTDNSNIDKNIFEVNVSCKYNEYDLENYVIYDGNKYKNQEVLILENNTDMQYYCEYNNEHILLDNKTITIESEYNLKEIKDEILENSYYSNEINYIYGKKVNIKSDIEYLSGYDNKDYYNNKYNYYIDLENKKYSILTINATDKIIISNPSYYYNIANDKFYSQVFDEND